jgi:hypothetical protein
MAAMNLLIGDLKLHHPTELTITSNHIVNYTNSRLWATRTPLLDEATEMDPLPAVLPSRVLAPETRQNYALHSAVVALTSEPSSFASPLRSRKIKKQL